MTESNDNEDRDLFKKEMAKIGIKQQSNCCLIKPNKIPALNNKLNNLPKTTYAKRRHNAQKKIVQNNTSCLSEFSLEGIDASEKIEHKLFLLSKKARRKLQKLQILEYNRGCCIDLHGYTIDQARDTLCHFIREASYNNTKYIQIVHGSSTSSTTNKNTLKSYCVHWLKQIPEVVAFCSAMGNTAINFGAINALLK